MRETSVAELPAIIDAVASWQDDSMPIQVHPGDLGWYQRFGGEALAEALRLWVRDGHLAAVGFLDESNLIRMAISPAAGDDEYLAARMADDFEGELGRLLPAGVGVVEARFGTALQHALSRRAWTADDPWTPLRRDLTDSVPRSALEVKRVGSDLIHDRVAVEAEAFPGSTFSAERWHQMAAGHAYSRGECLIGYDGEGVAVAAATIWSAGQRRPGLIEPLGVHHGYRGMGYGVAICLAAAEAMRQMGCSTAMVATPSSNVAAVATYRAAGFVSQGQVRDFLRP